MSGWKLVLDEDAFRFFISLPARYRKFLLQTFERLQSDPDRSGEYQLMDSTGRQMAVIAVAPFLVTYWLDDAVTEIRVVDIDRVRF